jgi:hypothetical protein
MNFVHKRDSIMPDSPAFSLLRLSALARLGGALIVAGGLWAVVWWALA